MAELLLEIEHLTKKYDDNLILDDFSLTVCKGEVIVVVGPSGCGKSTLLRCINALEPIQSGSIRLQREKIDPRSKNLPQLRQKIGMSKELETYQKIERSIITKFHKTLWTPFVTAVKRYELIQAGDRIAVCISGGKDSMLMAKLMQELQRHTDVPFDLVFLVMDPGYNEINRQKIESNAALLHIPIKVFETNVFEVANNADKSPCYLCAKMRRGYLYSKASEMGCNKIALGHHMSDVIETTVMGMFYGSQLQAMPPKLHSTNFKGMKHFHGSCPIFLRFWSGATL